MSKRSDIRKFASQLVALSRTDGLLDEQRIRAILQILPKKKSSLILFEQYYCVLKRAIANERLTIYSDSALSDSQQKALISYFEKRCNRRLRARFDTAPELIAGIRVQVGDKILEQSIRSTLEALVV